MKIGLAGHLGGDRQYKIVQHFSAMIKGNVDQIVIDLRVKCKLIVGSQNFMSKLDVKECMALLNPKRVKVLIDFWCVPTMTTVIPCLNPCLPCSVTFIVVYFDQQTGALHAVRWSK